jgi:hypothetical protein
MRTMLNTLASLCVVGLSCVMMNCGGRHSNSGKIGDAQYSLQVSKSGGIVNIYRDGKKVCQIAESGDARTNVFFENPSNGKRMLSFDAQLVPDGGLRMLSFDTPEDEAVESRAVYQWLGSGSTEKRENIGVRRYDRDESTGGHY